MVEVGDVVTLYNIREEFWRTDPVPKGEYYWRGIVIEVGVPLNEEVFVVCKLFDGGYKGFNADTIGNKHKITIKKAHIESGRVVITKSELTKLIYG